MSSMTSADVFAQFEQVRSDQIATIFSRRNPGSKVAGVRFGDIDKLTKKIKQDSDLAIELWDSGVMEARELACRIIEPERLTKTLAGKWVKQINFPVLADSFAGVVYNTPYALEKMTEWTQRDEEFVRRTGFCLVYRFAADPASDVDDKVFVEYLNQIESEIHESANWAREMMNMVPIAIGKRNAALFPKALEVARAYGKISVFHGDKTNCKITDAVESLSDPRVRTTRSKK
jgi:3-methyladenine DNA glycosylase AlkD